MLVTIPALSLMLSRGKNDNQNIPQKPVILIKLNISVSLSNSFFIPSYNLFILYSSIFWIKSALWNTTCKLVAALTIISICFSQEPARIMKKPDLHFFSIFPLEKFPNIFAYNNLILLG